MNNDAELLRRYASTGDAQAFTALVQSHLPMVYRAAWRQLAGDAHAAEDAAQMVFTLLARKAGGLVHHANLAGWLHLATRHVVRDQRRAAKRRAAREQEAVQMNAAAEDSGSADWDRLRPVLDEALGDLGAADREAVLLRFFQGLSLSAVGAALNVSEEAARMRVNRSLERLRIKLARRGITSTAAALGLALTAEPALAAPGAGLATSVSAAALAHGVGAGTGAAALGWAWHFMNSAKLAATGVVALATVGWATWEHGQLARVLPAEAPLQASAAPVPAKPRPSSPPPMPTRAPDPAAQRAAEAEARGEALMAAHPEVRAAFEESARAGIAARYAPYYAERRLTPAQRTAFEDIMLEAGAGHTIGGLDPAGDLTLRLPKLLSGDEREELLRQALGPEEWAAYQAYEESRSGASYVRDVVGLMSNLGEPMSTEQARALRQLIVTARPAGAPRTPGAFWDAVMAKATSVLPAAQVEALALFRARDELSAAEAEVAKAELRAKAGKG
jgi:RNA polymerase sigma factor (sigma-70 family)